MSANATLPQCAACSVLLVADHERIARLYLSPSPSSSVLCRLLHCHFLPSLWYRFYSLVHVNSWVNVVGDIVSYQLNKVCNE